MVNTKLKFDEAFFKEEVKCGFTVTTQMKEIQAIQLDLLNEFMNVCKKHNLKYWADAGTLLGCARHQGFIPWDDDIDLVMPREDYEKFLKIGPREFKHPYFFQTEKTDIGSLRWFVKICNSETTSMFINFMDREFRFNQGIALDIMPLDNIPDDHEERLEYFHHLLDLQNQARQFANTTYRYVFHNDKSNKSIKIFKNIAKVLLRTFLEDLNICSPWNSKINKYVQKYNSVETKCFGTNVFKPDADTDRACLTKTDFDETVYLPFEMFSLPCPKNYDNVLKNYYGEWKEFVQGGAFHTNIFYDTENSYKKYIRPKGDK